MCQPFQLGHTAPEPIPLTGNPFQSELPCRPLDDDDETIHPPSSLSSNTDAMVRMWLIIFFFMVHFGRCKDFVQTGLYHNYCKPLHVSVPMQVSELIK